MLYIFLLTSKVGKVRNRVFNSIYEDSRAFASYSKGLVYIGDEIFLEEIVDEVGYRDILVLDERELYDSNMKVYSSFKVINWKDKSDILKILVSYEKANPSRWSRSYKSMFLEWEIHNLLFYLGVKKNRTIDVDFNNADEQIYNEEGVLDMLRL